jgi:hypothetical protein
LTAALARREGLLAPFRAAGPELIDFSPDGGGVSLPWSLAVDGSDGVGEKNSGSGVLGARSSNSSKCSSEGNAISIVRMIVSGSDVAMLTDLAGFFDFLRSVIFVAGLSGASSFFASPFPLVLLDSFRGEILTLLLPKTLRSGNNAGVSASSKISIAAVVGSVFPEFTAIDDLLLNLKSSLMTRFSLSSSTSRTLSFLLALVRVSCGWSSSFRSGGSSELLRSCTFESLRFFLVSRFTDSLVESDSSLSEIGCSSCSA